MRVLLADDQKDVLSALRLIIQQDPDLQVVGEVTKASALLETIEEVKPDILILDRELSIYQMDQLLNTLWELYPKVHVITLSSREFSWCEACKAGVFASISKTDPPDRLISLLQRMKESIHPEGG